MAGFVEYMPPREEATITVLPDARPTGPFSVYVKVRPACAMRSIHALSWLGTEKLYIGAPTTITSAARNWLTSFSEISFSLRCTSDRPSALTPIRKPSESALRWLGASCARSRCSTLVCEWVARHWVTMRWVSSRETELPPRGLESMWSSFMAGLSQSVFESRLAWE